MDDVPTTASSEGWVQASAGEISQQIRRITGSIRCTCDQDLAIRLDEDGRRFLAVERIHIRPVDAAISKGRVQRAVFVVSRNDPHKHAVLPDKNDFPVCLPGGTGNMANRRLRKRHYDLANTIRAVTRVRRPVAIEPNERKLERAAAAIKPVTLADDQYLAIRQDEACQRNVVNSCIGGGNAISSKGRVKLPDSWGSSYDK